MKKLCFNFVTSSNTATTVASPNYVTCHSIQAVFHVDQFVSSDDHTAADMYHK